jgi:hypothetical protein
VCGVRDAAGGFGFSLVSGFSGLFPAALFCGPIFDALVVARVTQRDDKRYLRLVRKFLVFLVLVFFSAKAF